MLTEWPRVSIVMPVYNGGHYFALALQSALAQDYPDFEIVVVDDGSQDGGEVGRIAREGGERVRYIRQDNKGVAGALNTAREAMTGDIFCWLSHDDLYLPHKTRRQALYHRQLGDPDGVLFTDYDLIGPEGEYLQTIRADRPTLLQAPMLALLTGSINGCTLFAPATVMNALGPFEEQYRYTQDYRLWNRLLGRFEFYHQPEVTVRYRVHPGQDSNKPAAVSEGEALWIDMMDDRSEVERVQMRGSTQRFFASMARHLEQAPYPRALHHARERAAGAVAATLVSVVVAAPADDAALRATIASLTAQSHPLVEILVVGPAASGSIPGATRLLPADGAASTWLQAGLLQSRGDYLICLRAGEQLAPEDLAQRVAAMQERGGFLGHVGTPPDPRHLMLGTPLALKNLMFHRALLGEGFELSPHADVFGDGVSLAGLLRSHPPTMLETAQ